MGFDGHAEIVIDFTIAKCHCYPIKIEILQTMLTTKFGAIYMALFVENTDTNIMSYIDGIRVFSKFYYLLSS